MHPPLRLGHPREAQSPFLQLCLHMRIIGDIDGGLALVDLGELREAGFCAVILLDKVDPMRAAGLVQRDLNIRDLAAQGFEGDGPFRAQAVTGGDLAFQPTDKIPNPLDLALKIAMRAGLLSVADKEQGGGACRCVGGSFSPRCEDLQSMRDLLRPAFYRRAFASVPRGCERRKESMRTDRKRRGCWRGCWREQVR